MLGAIAGDIIGSPYEFENIKTTSFELFQKYSQATDDSILTIATADAILNDYSFTKAYKDFYRDYACLGYGFSFKQWAESSSTEPYNSWGNGSAMRVSPVGWVCDYFEETMILAQKSAECTHNHPEGIKGAQATAAAIFLIRKKIDRKVLKGELMRLFGYDLNRTLDEIRPLYDFDASCQGTVPEAIIAYLESTDFEDCIRKAVSLGGDSDTLAAIAGSIAEAEYGVPDKIREKCLELLDSYLIEIISRFEDKY